MAQHDNWLCCRTKPSTAFNAAGNSKSVNPIADAETAEVNGILILTSENTHADVGELFGQFCRKYLCMESWEFILEAVHYQVNSQGHLSGISTSVNLPRYNFGYDVPR